MAQAVDPGSTVSGAMRSVRAAIDAALEPGGSGVDLSTETRIVNALHALRTAGAEHEVIERVETISVWVWQMLAARREGRPNFYHSRMLRLRNIAL